MQRDLLTQAEETRVAALAGLESKSQAALGQYFTPSRAATLIARMPRLPETGHIRVLDPGAGSGMLTAALVDRVLHECPGLSVHVVAVERDSSIVPFLEDTLEACSIAGGGRITTELIAGDYLTEATGLDANERLDGFDLVIQNPPYAKLGTSSPARVAIRNIGIDAPNMYAAFLVLATVALNPGGQLVAITPRSFFNGPYFGQFRRYLLDEIALDTVHVFESRSTVFADTGVLQETVVFSGTRSGERDKVTFSTSKGHQDDAEHHVVAYSDVIHPDDPHRFIRITSNDNDTEIAERILTFPDTLETLAISVSTGRVVDFRSKDSLHTEACESAVPLIYPGNLVNGGIEWPREIRKPQWFAPASQKDEKLLLPEGWYCVVKRFSSKEERRRIVAAVWSPEQIPGPVAFENHINVFHVAGAGMDRETAFGLSLWLNSSSVDKFFRTFSGHTQVNATDLRTLRFPPRQSLRHLGSLAPQRLPEQEEVDLLVEKALDVVDTAA